MPALIREHDQFLCLLYLGLLRLYPPPLVLLLLTLEPEHVLRLSPGILHLFHHLILLLPEYVDPVPQLLDVLILL